MFGPIEEAQRARMNAVADALSDAFPEMGFALLIFKLGELGPEEGRMNYISNANREDMIIAMKELVANFEGRVLPPGNA